MLHPFVAAYYSAKPRGRLAELTVSDLDTAEHLWGGPDRSRAFRNLLVGSPEQRGEAWQAWVSTGEIELAEEVAYYALHQVQEVEGERVDRWAVYAALEVHEAGLHVHEDVLPEGVERARQGMEACESDLAPIFVGCEESIGGELRELLRGACAGRAPLLSFTSDRYGQHSVWELKDKKFGPMIRALFTGTPLFLLDGHHRLAAAKENARAGLGDGKILACICSVARTDTLILPIHRAVHYERWMLPEVLLADLERVGCRIAEHPDLRVGTIEEFLKSYRSQEPYCVVLHSHHERPRLVQLPRATKEKQELQLLPVACLDFAVLNQYAQVTAIPVSGAPLLLEQLALDQVQVGFFLPPSTPAQVRAIALARSRMPRKSTRFVPKPTLGLICRPWVSSG